MAHANGPTARGNRYLSQLVVGTEATSGVAQFLPLGQQQQLLQGHDKSVEEGERDELALAEAAVAYRASATSTIRDEDDDVFGAAVYSNDDEESKCSNSDVIVVEEVAGSMSAESADIIAELETPIQAKRRRLLNFGNDGMGSSNGERTPVVEKTRLGVDLKYGRRGTASIFILYKRDAQAHHSTSPL